MGYYEGLNPQLDTLTSNCWEGNAPIQGNHVPVLNDVGYDEGLNPQLDTLTSNCWEGNAPMQGNHVPVLNVIIGAHIGAPSNSLHHLLAQVHTGDTVVDLQACRQHRRQQLAFKARAAMTQCSMLA